MTAPFPETADIETSSDGYAARFAGPVGEWMLGEQERIVLARLAPRRPASVLDVGGGHGQLAAPLARAGYAVTVVGSDPSCARRVQPEVDAGRVKFVVGNVIALPFGDRSFDAVVSARLLPHCQRWPELIRELCRVARTSVIVDYPLHSRLGALLFGAKKKLERNTRTWISFSHEQVRAEFERNGFRVASREGQFLLPMVLHRTLKSRAASSALEAPLRALGLTARLGSPVILEAVRA